MLASLRIRSLALIESLDLDFSDGFTVLSGETGAGKSLLVGALGLVMGRKSSTDEVRSGAASAEVEAVFDIAGLDDVRSLLEEGDLFDGEELVLRRVISSTGRSRGYVNGRAATLAQLSSIARLLTGISSQRQYQKLLDPDFQLHVLDDSAGLSSMVENMSREYDAFVRARDEFRDFEAAAAQNSRRADYLQYQLRELKAAAFHSGELEEIDNELSVLKHVVRIEELVRSSERDLYSSRRSASELISAACRNLEEAAGLDAGLEQIAQQAVEARIIVEDAAQSLSKYTSSLEADPARLEQLELRHEELGALMRKHCVDSLEELQKSMDATAAELDDIENYDEKLSVLESRYHDAVDSAYAVALKLSAKRKKAAAVLSRKIEAEFKDLGLQKARIRVAVVSGAGDEEKPAPEKEKKAASLEATGIDSVEFMFRPNEGEPEFPLKDIASGGELSRVMLALDQALATKSGPATSVYDEVDAGIGGAVAHAVGLKLRSLSRSRQIICITHLPQVAALAQHHYSVFKHSRDKRTITGVRALSEEKRVEEVARMIGGARISSSALAAARDLMSHGMEEA